MAVWLNKKEVAGPFDGVLVVLNIGDGNYKTFSEKYIASVREAVNDAHAAGFLVLYLFDTIVGAMPPPDEFDNMEDMDFYRMMKDIWARDKADFAPLPNKRMEEFMGLVKSIKESKLFSIPGKGAKIIGSCSIAGSQTLMPLTEIK